MQISAISDGNAARLTVLFDLLPAEFEPHAGTWMIWPAGAESTLQDPGGQHTACAALACIIADFEPVTVCAGSHQKSLARRLLDPEIGVAEIAAERMHSKQPGLKFLTDGAGDVRIVNWRRNAWGALSCIVHAPWKFAETLRVETADMERAHGHLGNVSLRGASIRSDGDGTFFVAEESIQGMPHLSRPTRDEFAARLEDFCGARKVIWLPRGFADEHGVGRLDNLMTPVRRGVVALAWIEDPNDPRCEISREVFAILHGARDARDRPLEVIPLRNPPGARSAYVNFQFCNGAVVVPAFGNPRDAEAMASIHDLFPDREIIDLPANVRSLSTRQLAHPHATWKLCEETA